MGAVLSYRLATLADAGDLAELNRQLIEDEGSDTQKSPAELETRMRGWLSSEYTGVLFYDADHVAAYALYRDNEGRGVYLRQFFVVRDRRRQGVGRAAFQMLRREILVGTRITLDALIDNSRATGFWEAMGMTEYARMYALDG